MKKLVALMTTVLFVGSTGLVFARGGGGVGHASAATGTGTGTGSTVSTGAGKGRPHAASPKKRLKRQHKRIKDGVKNGTIDKQEATKLREEGKEINQERKADLKKDGGKLTQEDRKTLEGKLDDRSKEIYQDKHNGGTTGSTSSTTSGQ